MYRHVCTVNISAPPGRRGSGDPPACPGPGLRVRLIAAQGGRGPRPRPGCPQSHSARAASSRVKLQFKNRQDLRISSPSSERSEISVPHNLLTAILVGQRFHEHAVKFLSLLTYQHFATRIQGANKIAPGLRMMSVTDGYAPIQT